MRKATSLVLIVAVACLVLWDMVAVTAGGYEATISAIIYAFAKAHPIVPFAGGVLCGHLFWSLKESS